MNISIMLLCILTSFSICTREQCYTNLNQDMNCITIDVQEEGVVDLLHPECDPESPLQDYYFDYTSFGCLIPTYDMDEDGDGFAYGSIELTTNSDGVSLSVSLSCDNYVNLITIQTKLTTIVTQLRSLRQLPRE